MAIVGTDILYLRSTSDLGGAITATEIVEATLNNLWDDVSGEEGLAGDVEYRAFYIKNNHGTLTWYNVMAWINTNTPAGSSIKIGKEATKGSPKQSIANESTPPSGITFSAPASKATGLALGNLAPGEVYLIWVERTIPAVTSGYDVDYCKIETNGDTPA